MPQTLELVRDSLATLRPVPVRARGCDRPAAAPIADLTVTSDLASIAATWRAFARSADGTAFQTFEWLEPWLRHVGSQSGVVPAVVLGRFGDGKVAFILPLAIEHRRLMRRLVFLGRASCDYNAPLLAPDFARVVPASSHRAWWDSIRDLLGRHPDYRYDMVLLDKMPLRVGGQANPLASLPTASHPSKAYRARLTDDWDRFYFDKRSSATRRRDRNKRKKLADLGDLRIVTPTDPAEIAATLETLFAQKSRSFARMGVPDLFARPGHRAFFTAVACEAGSIVHVSRLDVAGTPAAINLGIHHGGSYYHVLASYDEGPVSRFGPGVLHLHELMQHAIRQNCAWFDFTIGDESYKRDWSDEILELQDHVSAESLPGAFFAFEAGARRRIKQAIKQSSWLWPLAGRLRAAPYAITSALFARAPARRDEDAT
jgi:CelD/BcsL family acetyltransferase involved in cellulose biosynthesis